MMKERLQGVIVGLLIGTLSAGTVVYAKGGIENIQVSYENIKVYKDNVKYDLKDASGKTVEPFVYNGTTYLPLRSVASLAGMDVTWESDTKSIYLWDEVSGPEKGAVDMMEVCQPTVSDDCTVYTKNDGESFAMSENYYISGLQFWGDSAFAEFDLNGKYSEMTFTIGNGEHAFASANWIITFTVDGKEVEEIRLSKDEEPKNVTISLNKGSKLRIDCNGNENFSSCCLGNIIIK
ncbi:stalk domain-containing protein [Anaerotignum sp.]